MTTPDPTSAPPELREKCAVDRAIDALFDAYDGPEGVGEDTMELCYQAERDLERLRNAALAWQLHIRGVKATGDDAYLVHRSNGDVSVCVEDEATDDERELVRAACNNYVPAFTPEQRAQIRAAIQEQP